MRMKIEQQVCTFEQADKLKRLGVPQVSIFFWCNEHPLSNGGFEQIDELFKVYNRRQFSAGNDNTFSAFTSSELGWMLIVDDDLHFTHTLYNEHLGVYQTILVKRDLRCKDGFKQIHDTEGEEETECKAEMVIYLLENNIISKYFCDLSNLSLFQ